VLVADPIQRQKLFYESLGYPETKSDSQISVFDLDPSYNIKKEHYFRQHFLDFPFGFNENNFHEPLFQKLFFFWRITMELIYCESQRELEYQKVLSQLAKICYVEWLTHEEKTFFEEHANKTLSDVKRQINKWKEDHELWDLCYVWRGFDKFVSYKFSNPKDADSKYSRGESTDRKFVERVAARGPRTVKMPLGDFYESPGWPEHDVYEEVVTKGPKNEVRYFYPFRTRSDIYKKLVAGFEVLKRTLDAMRVLGVDELGSPALPAFSPREPVSSLITWPGPVSEAPVASARPAAIRVSQDDGFFGEAKDDLFQGGQGKRDHITHDKDLTEEKVPTRMHATEPLAAPRGRLGFFPERVRAAEVRLRTIDESSSSELSEADAACFEQLDIDRAARASQRAITEAKTTAGEKVEALVIGVPDDGDCGFCAIAAVLQLSAQAELSQQFTRPRFIELVRRLNSDVVYERYISNIIRADKCAGFLEWQDKFSSSGYWLSLEHLNLLSKHYNIKFVVFYLDPTKGYYSVRPDADPIDEGDGEIVVNLAHITYGEVRESQLGAQNHYDGLLLRPTPYQKTESRCFNYDDEEHADSRMSSSPV
jgi:hypothetical protein